MPVAIAERPHAILGPSSWDRWSTCPGSVPMTEHLPPTSSKYAREGTAAHQLLEDCLKGNFDAEDLLGRQYEVEGEIFTVDMEMADAVNTALGWVREEVDVEAGDILMVEVGVPIAHLTGETDAEGSADIVAICDGGKTLKVMDYKHGKGVQVYASTQDGGPNGQMAMYAHGALHMLSSLYDEIDTVKMFIMQPRVEWFDSHEMAVDELHAFADLVTEAAGRVELNRQVALEGNELDLVPTDKGCKFCRAKHHCPAFQNLTVNALSVVSTAEDFEDLTLPKKAASVVVDDSVAAEKLAEAMRAIPMVEQFIKAVRAEVDRRLLAGEPVPGFKLVEGKKGNRQWRDAEEAAAELTKSGRLKADEAFEKKPISPTKAEKLLKDRPKIWSKIAPLITQSEGQPSVAPEDDPRPALQLGSTIEDFEDLTSAEEPPMIETDSGEKPLFERMKEKVETPPADIDPFA